MRTKFLATIGLSGGTLALAFGLTAPAAKGAPATAPLLQPSPRPTLVPTAVPAATAAPTRKPSRSNQDTPAAPIYGRVTGTVIDQRTGAPTAGVTVLIGQEMVTTDANGNYDHWLPVGNYAVSLVVDGSQGQPSQEPMQVQVNAETATVQHLFFVSPSLPAPVESAPVADVPTAPGSEVPPVSVSPAVEAPVSVPVRPKKSSTQAPDSLPTTGMEDTLPSGGLWMALVLMVAGGMLSMRRVRLALLPRLVGRNVVESESHQLLSALLTAQPRRNRRRATHKADALLLKSLLERDK